MKTVIKRQQGLGTLIARLRHMFAVLLHSPDSPAQLLSREWTLPPGTRKIAEYSRNSGGEVVLVEMTGRGAALSRMERKGMTAWEAASMEQGFALARSVIERGSVTTWTCRRRSKTR